MSRGIARRPWRFRVVVLEFVGLESFPHGEVLPMYPNLNLLFRGPILKRWDASQVFPDVNLYGASPDEFATVRCL